jgi:hypothetical protein
MVNRTLKIGLLGNAILSFLTGLALIIAHAPLAAYTGVPDARILVVVGVALLLFAIQLVLVSRRDPVRLGEIYYLSAMDGVWVLSSRDYLDRWPCAFYQGRHLDFRLSRGGGSGLYGNANRGGEKVAGADGVGNERWARNMHPPPVFFSS